MRDLRSSFWMWVKAILFLFIGIGSATLILLEGPKWKVLLLLCLTIWSFCRLYYSAFPGVFAAIRYLWMRRRL